MPASNVFIALTDRDEDNLIISLYAHQCGVHKIIAKSNRQNYSLIARSAGVESVVSPKLTTAYQILRMVRGIQNSKGSRMTALHHIANGQAEAMEFVVCSSTRNLGTPLKDLKLKTVSSLPASSEVTRSSSPRATATSRWMTLSSSLPRTAAL